MFFSRDTFGKFSMIRLNIPGDTKGRAKSDVKKRRAPKPSALRLENLEERQLLSAVPPFVDSGIDSTATPATESSYNAPAIAVPDLSAISATSEPLATSGTRSYSPYDEHDLGMLNELGMDENSSGVVWNNEGRLAELTVSNQELTEITLTGCAALTKLNVSDCANLQTLNCSGNELEELDVSGCVNLENLNCSDNELEELDVSGCANLKTLDCFDNELEELNVSGCVNLENLNCSDNALEELDLSNCTGLENLNCSGNKLEELDVSTFQNLTVLLCNDNALKSLDVSGLKLLEELNCDANKLTSVKVSECSSLERMTCVGNALKSLDLSSAQKLTQLRCTYEIKSVVLAFEAEVEINLPASDKWNSFSVVDGKGDTIESGATVEQTDSYSEFSFNVSSENEFPLTINYRKNSSVVGTTVIKTAPAAPTKLNVEFNAEKRVFSVSWTDNADNETGFVVEYSTDRKTWTSVSVPADVTTATLRDIEYDARYAVRVAAKNDVGSSAFVTKNLQTGFGWANLRVAAYNEKTGSLDVNWFVVGKEFEYLIEGSTDGGATWIPVALAEAGESGVSIPNVDLSESLILRMTASYDGEPWGSPAYAQVWNLANYPSYKAFALTSPDEDTVVLNGVGKDGSYTELTVGGMLPCFFSDFYICVLGQKSKQEDFTVAADVASRRGTIDFVDSGTNNTIAINCAEEDDVVVIGSEIVETTEQFTTQNSYKNYAKLLEFYAEQLGENTVEYLRLKAQIDKAYKSLLKKIQTIKTTWGTISIEGGSSVRFVGAKTATVNAGGGDDVVKVDSLGIGYVVSGGEGSDTLDFSNAAGAAKVNLGSKSAQSAIAKDKGKLTLTDAFRKFVGTVYNDTITGGSLFSYIVGNGGSDKVALVGGENHVELTGNSQSVTVGGTGAYYIKLDDATKSTIKASGVKQNSSVSVIASGNQIAFTGGSSEIVVRIEGDDAVVKNSGPAIVVVEGNNAKITTGKGDDVVQVIGDNATVNVGDGDDHVKIIGSKANVTLGGGQNTFEAEGESQTVTVKGTGTYFIELKGATGSTIKASSVNKNSAVTVQAVGDQITFNGGQSAINVSIFGDDAVVKNSGALSAQVVVEGNNAKITTGKGNDAVEVTGDDATVNVGDGDDIVIIHGDNSNVTPGKGADTIIVNDEQVGSGAILDLAFVSFWNDEFFGSDDDLVFTSQPAKLDGFEENNREVARLYANVYENWRADDNVDATFDSFGTQTEPDGKTSTLDGDVLNVRVWKES